MAASPAPAQSPVPAPWTAQDIARPTPAGRTTYNSGAFTLSAGGADIAGRSDSFHFAFQPLSGDTRIVARINNLIPADPASKIGLMIRSGLTASASHAYVYLNAVNRVSYGRRRSDSTRTVTTTLSSAWSAPVWLALTRTGSSVVAAVSTDGRTWTTIGTDTIALGTRAYVGLAIVGHSSTNAAQSDVSNVQLANGLPGTMADSDIGSPALAGSARYNAGAYTVIGSGDTYGSSDQFHFVYQPVTGDVDVSVRLASLSGTNVAARAGVMVRQSLAANAPQVFSVMMTSLGAGMLDRATTGGTTEFVNGGAGTAPVWLRIVRTGTRFDTYRSPNGVTWSLMASQTVAMGSTVYVGMAVASHAYADTATAVFDHFVVGNAPAPMPNQPPTVALTSPAPGASAVAPVSWTVSANATDPEGRLARVEFYVNGQLLGSRTAMPFSLAWSADTAGAYAVLAVAYDLDGGSTSSTSAVVTVTAPAPPVVTPRWVMFTPSADHATGVTGYRLNVYAASDPSTTSAVATVDFGKPTPDATNTITVDASSVINALAPGSYLATVSAIGPGGSTPSAPPYAFTR